MLVLVVGGASEMEERSLERGTLRREPSSLDQQGWGEGAVVGYENKCLHMKGRREEKPAARPRKALLFSRRCGKVAGFSAV